MIKLRLSLLLLFLLSIVGTGRAQVPVQISPIPYAQFTCNDGLLCSGGKIYTYIAGTTTPLATYRDSTGTQQNANPIVLDAAGRASIWLDTTNSYKFALFDVLGALQWTQDNVAVGVTANGNNTFTGTNTFNGTTDFNGTVNINSGGSLNGTFSGDPNFSGSPTFSGIVVASQFQSIIATGNPPLIVASTTNVPNLNVKNINGVNYTASPSDHSVPVVTASTANYKVIPNCPVTTGYLNFTQSTDSFGCGTAGTLSVDCQDTDGKHLNYTLSTTTVTCGTSINPNLITSVSNCGSSASCSGIAIVTGPHVIMGGPVITDGATPGLRTITGMSPAFTSATSYFCSLTIVGNSGISQAPEIMYVSGSSFQIYSNDGTMVTVDYICVGN